jgi:regulatory protein
MSKPLTPDQAMNRAAALCARSEQAPGDMREKLVKWGLNHGEASQVLSRLIEQGYIDERRYARAFVNDRFRFNGWGRIKIAHQLRLKGISSDLIDEAMTVIDEEQYRERLLELLRAKWRDVSNREPRAAWAAMMRFAASRGFEAGIAGECVNQVTRLDAHDD